MQIMSFEINRLGSAKQIKLMHKVSISGIHVFQQTHSLHVQVLCPTDPCISDDATYLGPAVFGYGPNTLNVNTWEVTVPQARFAASDGDILMKMVVTREHCVPFAQVIMGSFGGSE